MENKYIIIDLRTMEYFKGLDGTMKIFDTEEDAMLHCGIYEFENAWVCKLIYNHIEEWD